MERYEEFKNRIKELGFDIDIELYPKLQKTIKYYSEKNDIDGLIYYMNFLQNCGGYALQLPVCVFSGNDYTFEEQVLRILELYPFVRLLSDTQVNDNEYIVKYRSGKSGHHFVRVDENGNITEKNECNLPQKFQDWGILKDAPEAVFSVLKQEYRDDKINKLPQCNKDMFLSQDAYYENEGDNNKSICIKEAERPKTFRMLLKEAYNKKQSSFLYNNKVFYFKVNKDDSELVYICDDEEILGVVCFVDDDFLIEIDDKKSNRIYGFQPNKPIEINQDDIDLLQ